jgi:hypothetical protein
MAQTRWAFSCEAVDPINPNETWEVGILTWKLELLARNGHLHKLGRAVLVKAVVSDPICIIKGWDRPGHESCFVYVGKPNKDYRSATIEVPPPKGQLFVAFVLPDGTVDDWAWRPVSEFDTSRPEGILGDVLWPLPTT